MSVILALIESCNQALTASDELRFPPFCHRLTPDELIRVELVLFHLFPLCHTFFSPSISFFLETVGGSQTDKPESCHNVDSALIRAFDVSRQSARRGKPRAVKTRRAARAILNTRHLGRCKHSTPPPPPFPTVINPTCGRTCSCPAPFT